MPPRLRAALLVAGVGLLLTASRPVAQTPTAAVASAQAPPPALREAAPDEVWITQPTMADGPPPPARDPRTLAVTAATDTTPPTAPGNLQASIHGLTRLTASWSAASDAESGIEYYAFGIGTGTTPDTQANVRWWQSTATNTQASVNFAFAEGATYYVSVRANNGANLSSTVVSSGPLVPARIIYGQATNTMGYTLAPTGITATGAAGDGWPADRAASFTNFLDKMIPVLTDLYGPPSTAYAVTIIRDLRYTGTAVFFPSADEIHAGDTVHYQLLTHEMIHAFRRDRVLSSGPQWQFDPTFSGFEEGFAQAMSYRAMTEFARRHPAFGLTQQIYQSSMEWDYDFQNVPELANTDFWSESGGTLLPWTRYEVAAAAISKIEIEHPGFARAFNAEFYRRLNTDLSLTMSRALIKDIVATVAPSIEGTPAGTWVDRQYVFDCANRFGHKVWMFQQNYPTREYFIFNRTHFFETFFNGSEWAYWNGSAWVYYRLNGSTGTATLRTFGGSVVSQRSLLISPVENPPLAYGFGSDEINLTTQATNLPWPGGDATKYVTGLLDLGLYKLTVAFTDSSTAKTASTNVYRVVGAPLQNTAGVFGGVAGSAGGAITLRHRSGGPETTAMLVNGAFHLLPSWASQSHPETQSNDSTPGIVDVTYVDAGGNRYVDVRTIEYGSWNGTQVFLFDVATMRLANEAPVVTAQPVDQSVSVGSSATFMVTASGTPPPAYQWHASSNGGSSWTAVAEAAPYSGTASATLTVASAIDLSGMQYRATATNSLGTAVSGAATLTVGTAAAIVMQPQSQTISSGQSATLSVIAAGQAPLGYQWYAGQSGNTSTLLAGATTASYTTPALTSASSYWVQVTNGFGGPASSSTATITIGTVPGISAHPQPATINSGQSTTLNVTATGTAPLSYQWFAGDSPNTSNPIASATAPAYTTPALTTTTSYWVQVSNGFGPVANSSTATITIGAGPSITTHPSGQTIGSGQTATLSVVATGQDPLSYQWYTGSTPDTTNAISGATASTYTTPALTVATSYWVRVSNLFGSAANSSTAAITIGTPPAITAQPQSQTISSGQSVSLSVVATGTAPLSYQWYQGTSPSTAAPIAGANGSGYVTPSLTSTTGYWVRVSSEFGSVASDTATLTIGLGPAIIAHPQGQTIAAGQNIGLTVGASGTPKLSYQWYRGAAPITADPVSGAIDSSYTTPALTTTTSYWVQVTNPYGSAANSTTAVVSVGVGAGIVAQPQSQVAQSGQAVALTVTTSGTAPFTYQWYEGASGSTAAPIAGAVAAEYTTAPLTTTTAYWVQVANPYGTPVNSAAATLVVNKPSHAVMSVDSPGAGASIVRTFTVAGWAADLGSGLGTGIDAIHVYAFPLVSGVPGAGVFVGQATYGSARGDVGGAFGSQFMNSGYSLSASLDPGAYRLMVHGRSTVTGTFNAQRDVDVTVTGIIPRPAMSLDTPAAGATTALSFTAAGWAADRGAPNGPGVDAVHVYAFPMANGAPGDAVFVGAATYGGARADLAAAFGGQFLNTGVTLGATLPPGTYRVIAYAHSTVTGTFNNSAEADITVVAPVPRPLMAIDGPPDNATVTQPFVTGGWAVDLGATAGTGVDAIHVWAFPADGRPARFVDQATLGGARSDVAAVFGSQFLLSGYNFLMSGLSPGVYDIGVYAHSAVTGTFNQVTFVRVTVQ